MGGREDDGDSGEGEEEEVDRQIGGCSQRTGILGHAHLDHLVHLSRLLSWAQ